ncbi:MAG: outer membrane lipoprotein carrier protein LolA [Ginsengibacter sp.]|jgi:outer membrane lipoprotein-sorting protein
MLRRNLLFAIFTLAGITGFSQSNSLGNNDASAAELAKTVSAKFATYKTVAIKFSLKVENAQGNITNIQSGTMNMKGKMYKLSFAGQEIFSDGTTVWTYDKADKETQITKVDKSSNSITPEKLFSDFYSKDFLYKLNDDSPSNKNIQQIELTPRDKTNTYFKVLIDINKNTKNIVGAKIFEKNGNRYVYTITGFKTNIPIPESTFKYDSKAHPNVEIVDLR